MATNSSVSCTREAMIMMKASRRRYSSPRGSSSRCSVSQPTQADMVSTKVVAMPIPKADSTLLETPMKGQSPRKRDRTTLLTRLLARIISSSSFMAKPIGLLRPHSHCESRAMVRQVTFVPVYSYNFV